MVMNFDPGDLLFLSRNACQYDDLLRCCKVVAPRWNFRDDQSQIIEMEIGVFAGLATF